MWCHLLVLMAAGVGLQLVLTTVVVANSPTADQGYSVPQAEVPLGPLIGHIRKRPAASWSLILLLDAGLFSFTVAQLVPRARAVLASVGWRPFGHSFRGAW